ncbi:hypothetical protein DAI22_03g278500 [Oryza sativa Japonica Group]|nr:hypothetical protein DAI22_03g278500 [Oryza sativa Japonica Group]
MSPSLKTSASCCCCYQKANLISQKKVASCTPNIIGLEPALTCEIRVCVALCLESRCEFLANLSFRK